MLNVIFDMDGVIFDTEALCRRAWKAVGSEYGIKDIDGLLLLCIGANQQHMLEIFREKMGEKFPAEKFLRETKEKIQKLADESLPVKKGARELLKWLKDRRVPVGLASSTECKIVEKYLSISGLSEYFQVIVGGDQIRHSKPDPEIYQKACEALGIDPADAYGIEDSYNGVRSASAAGLKTIMVPDLLPPTEEMEKLAYRICSDLVEVKEYFAVFENL